MTKGTPESSQIIWLEQRVQEQADRIYQLEKTLRLAAGYISAQVNHWQDKNPHDVLAWLIEVAEEDSRAALGEKQA